MTVDLILLEDVDGLGAMGDQVRVSKGYARNFLLPKRYAAMQTTDNTRQLEARMLRMQKEHAERVTVAQTMAGKINAISVTIPVQASDTDKLYGSVTDSHIAGALKEEGIEIDRTNVVLQEPIRELGVYTIDIHLHEEVNASLKVWVVRA